MRWWIWVIGILMAILIAVVLVLPYGLKWYVEKNDQKLIGREMQLDDIDLNLFTGKVKLKDVTLYEPNQQDIFLQADRLGIQIAWTELFQDRIHLEEVFVQSPQLRVIQQGKQFNFDDLLALAESDSASSTNDKNYAWQIDTLWLNPGKLTYIDQLVESQLVLDSVTITIPSVSDQTTVLPAHLSFQSGEGTWSNQISLDLNRETYSLQTNIADWSLQPFTPYFTSHINLTEFDSKLGAAFSLVGSYSQTDSLALSGTFSLQDLVMTDLEQDSLLAWNELNIAIDSANTASQYYDFGNIKLTQPYLLFELTAEGDNFSRALALSQADSVVQQELQDSTEFTSPFEYLALYLYELTQAYLSTSYVADTILIDGGSLDYTDQTLANPFKMQLSELSALATDITEQDEYADFDISSKVNGSGDLSGDLQISRSGIRNMELDLEIQNLSVNDLNAYTTHYMGHPFQQGDLFFTSKNSIEDYYLNSENNLFVTSIEVGDKSNKNALYNVPMKLAVTLLRDTKGNVDLKVPISGNLNDPDYYLGRIILKVLVNVLVKAATSPYRLMANLVGGKEEDFKNISFSPLSYQLESKQKRKLNYVAKLLKQKPALKVFLEFIPEDQETEDMIALSEVKKSYWFSQGLVSQDSTWLLQTDLTPDDSLFVAFMENSLPIIDSVTEQNFLASCRAIVEPKTIDSVQQQLWQRRQVAVDAFFSQQENISAEQWDFQALSVDSTAVDSSSYTSYQLKYQLQ
ncbi:MAG: DUF748 domain-containing protein [Bacteroidota bacterium]